MLKNNQEEKNQEPDDAMGFDRRLAYWLVVVVVTGLIGSHLYFYLHCLNTEDPYSCAREEIRLHEGFRYFALR